MRASSSSAYRPSGEACASSRSHSSVARSASPISDSAETSQNEQIRNVPSSPVSPSSVSVDPVAQDESALLEAPTGDREHGRLDALVVGREEADQGDQQGRRVERVGFVVLAEHAALGNPVLEDVVADLVGDALPLGGQLRLPLELGQPRPPIERHPAHQLRRDVVLGLAARLPDALVGLLPDRDRAPDLVLDDRPQSLRDVAAHLGVQVDRVEHGAEHVVLVLLGRRRFRS